MLLSALSFGLFQDSKGYLAITTVAPIFSKIKKRRPLSDRSTRLSHPSYYLKYTPIIDSPLWLKKIAYKQLANQIKSPLNRIYVSLTRFPINLQLDHTTAILSKWVIWFWRFKLSYCLTWNKLDTAERTKIKIKRNSTDAPITHFHWIFCFHHTFPTLLRMFLDILLLLTHLNIWFYCIHLTPWPI